MNWKNNSKTAAGQPMRRSAKRPQEAPRVSASTVVTRTGLVDIALMLLLPLTLLCLLAPHFFPDSFPSLPPSAFLLAVPIVPTAFAFLILLVLGRDGRGPLVLSFAMLLMVAILISVAEAMRWIAEPPIRPSFLIPALMSLLTLRLRVHVRERALAEWVARRNKTPMDVEPRSVVMPSFMALATLAAGYAAWQRADLVWTLWLPFVISAAGGLLYVLAASPRRVTKG